MQYDDQTSRMVRAFCHYATLCVMACHCGRVHFVSAPGHGDYEEGELEELKAKAEKEPDKYIEEWEHDTIDEITIDGKSFVAHCKCEGWRKYSKWIDRHAEQITKYLGDFWIEKAKDAKAESDHAEKMKAALDRAEEAGL